MSFSSHTSRLSTYVLFFPSCSIQFNSIQVTNRSSRRKATVVYVEAEVLGEKPPNLIRIVCLPDGSNVYFNSSELCFWYYSLRHLSRLSSFFTLFHCTFDFTFTFRILTYFMYFTLESPRPPHWIYSRHHTISDLHQSRFSIFCFLLNVHAPLRQLSPLFFF